MKTIKNLFAILILVIAGTSCQRGNSIVISNNEYKLKVTYWGDIKFTDDETSIKSISRNGYFKYRKNDDIILAKSNSKGEITYDLFLNKDRVQLNSPEGKKLLADAVKEMISVGFDLQGRLQRLCEKGGLRAVLSAVDGLDGDFIKSQYLEYLISSDSVSQDELTEIAKKIGKQLGSDFEKGKLLQRFALNSLNDSLTSTAYYDAVQSIGSDFEKANALKTRLKNQLTQNQFINALAVTNTIGSDFEKSNLLKEFIDQEMFEKESFDRLLNSVSQVNSDFERGNLLKKLIEKNIVTDVQWSGIINESGKVSSEFERGNILVQIAGKMPKNEELKSDYLKVAQTINSEVDHRKVVDAIE